MAKIQWFPGHMHKASKEMRQALSGVDLLIELLDSRLPYSSQNPMLTTIRGDKPVVRVLTRCDMSDPSLTERWQQWFIDHAGEPAIAHSPGARQTVDQLIQRCRKIMTGTRQTVTAMVVGIPNVGKSTLINLVAGRSIAKTGNEPAVTRMQQRIQLDQHLALLDTPGVLWPNVENPLSGLRLASTGAIRETALEQLEVARYLGGYLLGAYPEQIERRYRFPVNDTDPELLLNHVGKTRGGLRKGGRVDLDRAARVLLNDFRELNLGRITLETPEMMEEELQDVAAEIDRKETRKAQRKEAFRRSREGG